LEHISSAFSTTLIVPNIDGILCSMNLKGCHAFNEPGNVVRAWRFCHIREQPLAIATFSSGEKNRDDVQNFVHTYPQS